MSEKWDALRIAKWFEGGYGGCEMEAAAELRRLHAENKRLETLCYDYLGELERFAALVAAAEREACAKVCEDYSDKSDIDHESHGYACATAIRARGQE